MKTKKIICGILICTLAISLFSGCNTTKPADDAVLTATDIAMQQIEGSKLTEDEMFEIIKEYYSVFNAIFKETGENIVAEVVKTAGNEIEINTTRPELDSSGTPTGKTVEDKAIFSWKTVKEAFAYLYEQQQIDLEGNILFSEEDILSPSTQPEGELADSTAESNVDSGASDVSSEDGASSGVISESASGADATTSQASNG